ncbi:MAG TPA: DUF1330 domain-containing protein [Dinghuibacter sp.]|uniref:DUF1330 domain-containing protein n=1 Tax=Dinghuibacter sp. TaxID=2024697 RepID=UPI002B603262|nr:DUF1330 domain-containing protein [Dinghuibacter sp.]HTJ14196.1 DUF1330 domain-containing protein [Dinghuibacter sp.]
MPAYVIFTREKTFDQNELHRYKDLVPASFVGRAVKPLASGTRFATLEGDAIDSVTMLEFPTMAEAEAWYRSPEYQEASKHRLKGGEYRCWIIESV